MIEAFNLKRRGYYKQAIEIYYKLLSEVKDNVEILSELADLYYLLKNNERAKHYISKVLEINKTDVSALKVLKKVYISESNMKDAEEIAQKIYNLTDSEDDLVELTDILDRQYKYDKIIELTKNSESAKCNYRYAVALYHLKRYDEVKRVLNEINFDDESEPKLTENILKLKGKILYEDNMMDEAKEVFKKLEDINAQTPESLNLIGLDKLDELKPDEAIDYFNRAVEKDDKNPKYFYNMGQAYFLKGWLDEAQKCFSTAICLNPTEEKYHYSLAYLYYKSGNFEGAKSHLNTDDFNSKVLLQIIKSEEGDLASPKIELEKMLKDSPDNETIVYALAKIYYNLDMLKQSKTLADMAVELNPKSFEYQIFRIKLMLKLGMTDECETEINALISKYPKYYYAKVLEAELYLAKQDYDSLFDTAQELIDLDINHYEGYYYNALSLFEKEDISFAIESLKKAISLDVNNADLYVKMSEFYQAVGKYEDAFAYIKEASDIDKSAKNRELYIKLASILKQK